MSFKKMINKQLLVLFLLTAAIPQNVFSTDLPKGCWIPESYVEHLHSSLDHKDVKSMLMPFANIVIGEETVAIKAYGSESATVVHFQKSGTRAKLLHIEHIVNEKYFDQREVKETEFYLSRDGNFLILTIEKQGTRTQVRFVKELQGVVFTSYYDAIFRIKITKYFSIVGLNQPISFTMDGSITEFPKWLRYELIRDYPYVANDRVVTLVKIIGTDTKKNYAIHISNDQVDLYDYEWRKHDVVLSLKPVYSLQVSVKK